MTRLMPQELAVWYLIPSLRKELAKCMLKEKAMKQKRVAKLLGITEAAVSQYLKQKRANELRFSDKEHRMIRKTAAMILDDEKGSTTHIYRLAQRLMGAKGLCELHRRHQGDLPKNCRLCMK